MKLNMKFKQTLLSRFLHIEQRDSGVNSGRFSGTPYWIRCFSTIKNKRTSFSKKYAGIQTCN